MAIGDPFSVFLVATGPHEHRARVRNQLRDDRSVRAGTGRTSTDYGLALTRMFGPVDRASRLLRDEEVASTGPRPSC